jgi:very-short-patch-repair endonuclease
MRINSSPQSPSEFVDGRIAPLAAAQHGVLHRTQALELGMSTAQIKHRVRSGRWQRVLPGVYRIAGGSPPTIWSRAFAVVLWAGEGAAVSHGSAAGLVAMPMVRSRITEVLVPPGRDLRSPWVRVHRGELDACDRQIVNGVPVTTPTRTLIDVAGRLEDDALLAVMEDAFRRGLCTPELLGERLAALQGSGRPGTGRLAALLAARPRGARPLESPLEARAWAMLQRSSLPRPERQHWIVVEGTRYRLDFAWPDHKVAVECDGWSHHGGREHFERDELRRARMTSVGWRLVPVTAAQCARSEAAVIERIARALRLAA